MPLPDGWYDAWIFLQREGVARSEGFTMDTQVNKMLVYDLQVRAMVYAAVRLVLSLDRLLRLCASASALVQVRLDRLLCRFGRPLRWAAQSISLLGNKPIYKEGTDELFMWEKHSAETALKQTVKTLQLFPSDHFGVVLNICGPHVKPSRWDGDDDSDSDHDDDDADDADDADADV
jgi:hypothetical protein